MAPNIARTISCKAWKSPIEYPRGDFKHDTKKSDVNMSKYNLKTIKKRYDDLNDRSRDMKCLIMITSSKRNIFRVTGHLCGEFTGHRRIPRTKASDTELWCFILICVWINGWINNGEAGDWRRHRAHYDVIVMSYNETDPNFQWCGCLVWIIK